MKMYYRLVGMGFEGGRREYMDTEGLFNLFGRFPYGPFLLIGSIGIPIYLVALLIGLRATYLGIIVAIISVLLAIPILIILASKHREDYGRY
jgi:hypothetical protein